MLYSKIACLRQSYAKTLKRTKFEILLKIVKCISFFIRLSSTEFFSFFFFQVFYRTYQEYIPAKFCHSSQFMDFFMFLSFWLFKNASNRRKWTNANSMSEEKVTQENAKCQKVQ